MTEWLLDALTDYGTAALFAITFASCLALPVPASFAMLAAGAFAASGDLALTAALLAALLGAVAGDQAGFAFGRAGGPVLVARLSRGPRRRAAIEKARAMLDRHGGKAIFLTRWLFSPVGPWANLAAGAGGMAWSRFTLAGILGEAVWVGLYTGAGWLFAGNLLAAYDLIGSTLGLIGALAAATLLGLWLNALRRRPPPAPLSRPR